MVKIKARSELLAARRSLFPCLQVQCLSVTQARFIKGGLQTCRGDKHTTHAGLFWEKNRFQREIWSETFRETKGGIIIHCVRDDNVCVLA